MEDWSMNYEGVLPSGVAFELSEILTEDQDKLISSTSKGNVSRAFQDLLLARLERLGDKAKGDIPRSLVARMLDADMKYALLKLHTHSFQDEEEFKFTVEFPIERGEKEKIRETHSVNLFLFDVKPYTWVQQKMDEMEGEGAFFDVHEFPVCYESYEQMLEEQAERRFKIETPKGEKEIKWHVLAADSEPRFKASYKDKGDFVSMIYMRGAKHSLQIDAEGDSKTVWQAVQWEKVPARIQETFRKEFMSVEGNVDSTVTIKSEKNPRKQTTIDLLATGEFYSPSLAR